MNQIADSLEPKEKVRILLIKNGRPTAGVYLEDGKEIRSPSLDKRSKNVPNKNS